MDKQKAMDYYGSLTKLARAVDRTPSSVSEWPEIVPEGMAYKIQVLTRGRLKVDPEVYRRGK
jgi:hypothetical protein